MTAFRFPFQHYNIALLVLSLLGLLSFGLLSQPAWARLYPLHFPLVTLKPLPAASAPQPYGAYGAASTAQAAPSPSAVLEAQLLLKAETLLQAGDIPRASSVLQALASKQPNNWVPRLALAQLALRANYGAEAPEAVLQLEQLQSQHPDEVTLLAAIADACWQLNRGDEAQAWLEQAAALDPEHPWVLALQAQRLRVSSQAESPLVPEQRPLDSAVAQEAASYLQTALSAYPQYHPALLESFYLFLKQNRLAEAQETVLLLQESYPEAWTTSLAAAELFNRLDKPKLALRYGQQSQQQDLGQWLPRDALLALVSQRLGLHQEALPYLKRLQQAQPTEAEWWFRLAEAEAALNHPEQALAYRKQAYALAPERFRTLLASAQALTRQSVLSPNVLTPNPANEGASSWPLWEDILTLEPSNPIALNSLSAQLVYWGQQQQLSWPVQPSLPHKQSQTFSSERLKTVQNLLDTALREQQSEFNRSGARDPKQQETLEAFQLNALRLEWLAWQLQAQQQGPRSLSAQLQRLLEPPAPPEALKEAVETLALQGQDPLSSGLAFLQLGEISQARSQWELFDSSEALAFLLAADQVLLAGEWDSAKRLYQRGLELAPNDDLKQGLLIIQQLEAELENLLAKGNQAYDKETYAEAQRYYQQALTLAPYSANVLLRLGDTLERQSHWRFKGPLTSEERQQAKHQAYLAFARAVASQPSLLRSQAFAKRFKALEKAFQP